MSATRTKVPLADDRITVALTEGHGAGVEVGVRDDVRELLPGEPQAFELATSPEG